MAFDQMSDPKFACRVTPIMRGHCVAIADASCPAMRAAIMFCEDNAPRYLSGRGILVSKRCFSRCLRFCCHQFIGLSRAGAQRDFIVKCCGLNKKDRITLTVGLKRLKDVLMSSPRRLTCVCTLSYNPHEISLHSTNLRRAADLLLHGF